MAILLGLISGFFSSFKSVSFFQNTVFLLNCWLIVDVLTIRKLKIVVIMTVAGLAISMMRTGSSVYKYNIVGSMVSENFIDMPVYLELLRFKPFIGSDYVTFSLFDFIIPSLCYKFMNMLDLKREDWLIRNQMILGSSHPQYGKITGKIILVVAVSYLIGLGGTMDNTQFYSMFLFTGLIVVSIVLCCTKDLANLRTFGKDLSQEIPNIGDENLMQNFQELIEQDAANNEVLDQVVQEEGVENEIQDRGYMDQLLDQTVSDGDRNSEGQDIGFGENSIDSSQGSMDREERQKKQKDELNAHLYDEHGQDGGDVDLSLLEQDSRFLENQPFLL